MLTNPEDTCPHKSIEKTTVLPDGSVFGACAQCGDESFVLREVAVVDESVIKDGQIWVADSVPSCLVVPAQKGAGGCRSEDEDGEVRQAVERDWVLYHTEGSPLLSD